MADEAPKMKWTTDHEETWRGLAIALAIITPVVAAFWIPWIIGAVDEQKMLYRVQITGAGVAVGLALVTFCTVVWRGLISARQADTGLEQLDGLRRQIIATEENNLAQQLQKGAELLGDEARAKVSAGIATLAAISTGSPNKFDSQARRLLLHFVQTKGRISHGSDTVTQACRALVEAYNFRPMEVVERLFFEEDDELSMFSDDYSVNWQYVLGGEKIDYVGGNFISQIIAPQASVKLRFKAVDFYECIFPDLSGLHLERCRFHDCAVERVDASTLGRQRFEGCSFSRSIIRMNAAMPDLRETSNWFHPLYPPIFMDNPGPNIRPDDVLCSMEPPDDQGEW